MENLGHFFAKCKNPENFHPIPFSEKRGFYGGNTNFYQTPDFPKFPEFRKSENLKKIIYGGKHIVNFKICKKFYRGSL